MRHRNVIAQIMSGRRFSQVMIGLILVMVSAATAGTRGKCSPFDMNCQEMGADLAQKTAATFQGAACEDYGGGWRRSLTTFEFPKLAEDHGSTSDTIALEVLAHPDWPQYQLLTYFRNDEMLGWIEQNGEQAVRNLPNTPEMALVAKAVEGDDIFPRVLEEVSTCHYGLACVSCRLSQVGILAAGAWGCFVQPEVCASGAAKMGRRGLTFAVTHLDYCALPCAVDKCQEDLDKCKKEQNPSVRPLRGDEPPEDKYKCLDEYQECLERAYKCPPGNAC